MAPSFPGLIPSPLPHLPGPERPARSRSLRSEGRLPGDKSKVRCGSGLFPPVMFHRTTEFETGVPAAKTWADPGFKYYKIQGSFFKKKKCKLQIQQILNYCC